MESSGLETARNFASILYTHNDSGGIARFFAVGADGLTKAVYTLQGDGAGSSTRKRGWLASGERLTWAPGHRLAPYALPRPALAPSVRMPRRGSSTGC